MPEPAQMRVAPHKTRYERVQITSVSGRTLLRLKSWLPEYTTRGKPVALAGQELPSRVGATLSGAMHALCVGPGEWLITLHEHQASSLREHIEPDLSKQGLVLVDLTDGLAVLQAQGSAVREVLCKGCGLDFHPRSFLAGRCARTRFAQIPVVIECLDEPPRFDFYVARSYLRYLHSWFTDATAEFDDGAI
jgi:sarcosine oxidase subunit gamma